MSDQKKSAKIAIITLLVGSILCLHYFTIPDKIYHHALYRVLFYLPLILGSFWFGLKGALYISAAVFVSYLPFVIICSLCRHLFCSDYCLFYFLSAFCLARLYCALDISREKDLVFTACHSGRNCFIFCLWFPLARLDFCVCSNDYLYLFKHKVDKKCKEEYI